MLLSPCKITKYLYWIAKNFICVSLFCRYPAINKPAGIVHWLKHSKDAENVDWVVILDADMIIRGPIIPWELGAEKGRPVAALYGYCTSLL